MNKLSPTVEKLLTAAVHEAEVPGYELVMPIKTKDPSQPRRREPHRQQGSHGGAVLVASGVADFITE